MLKKLTNKSEKFAPLTENGVEQTLVGLRSLRRAGRLDLYDQQGERDRENCVRKAFEPREATLRAMRLCHCGLLRLRDSNSVRADGSNAAVFAANTGGPILGHRT